MNSYWCNPWINKAPDISTLKELNQYKYIEKKFNPFRVTTYFFYIILPALPAAKFPKFKNWQDSYGAFTYSIEQKDIIINYVKNQKKTP